MQIQTYPYMSMVVPKASLTHKAIKNKFGELIQFLEALYQAKTSMVSPFEGFQNKQITEQKNINNNVIFVNFCVALRTSHDIP